MLDIQKLDILRELLIIFYPYSSEQDAPQRTVCCIPAAACSSPFFVCYAGERDVLAMLHVLLAVLIGGNVLVDGLPLLELILAPPLPKYSLVGPALLRCVVALELRQPLSQGHRRQFGRALDVGARRWRLVLSYRYARVRVRASCRTTCTHARSNPITTRAHAIRMPCGQTMFLMIQTYVLCTMSRRIPIPPSSCHAAYPFDLGWGIGISQRILVRLERAAVSYTHLTLPTILLV
eukprot:9489506-Pyramimonas_sp.AAC.1